MCLSQRLLVAITMMLNADNAIEVVDCPMAESMVLTAKRGINRAPIVVIICCVPICLPLFPVIFDTNGMVLSLVTTN